jgi:predicted RNA polymerase sigma factor
MTAADIHRTIVAVWRIEQPRLITGLARMLRDVPLAEDLTQEALLAALEHWPATGVPEKPGAWLMATAKRRALDHLRRGQMLSRKHEMIAGDLEQEQQVMPDLDSALDDDIGDELLRLIFTACHPLLARDHRPAHRARQADAFGIRAGLRDPARRGTVAAPGFRAGSRLSHLQRRLHRGARRALAASTALP